MDADQYTQASTERCGRVLGTLFRSVGAPWVDRLCLVGGLAPRYIVPSSGYHQPPHVGSTDVDVALSVAVSASDGAYRTLEGNLKRIGFDRVGDSSWRWQVAVDGEPVVLELLGEDASVPGGRIISPKVKPPAGTGGVGLLNVLGAELAFADRLKIEREFVMLDGAASKVVFNVANLAPFVAMKADAYLDRRKAKDAYDLIYVLRWWDGGPSGAAMAFLASPVAGDAFVTSALARITRDFADAGRVGPVDYASLARPYGAPDEIATACNEAVAVWSAFVRGVTDGVTL